eukprot:3736283-Amphidinium_carterae.1
MSTKTFPSTRWWRTALCWVDARALKSMSARKGDLLHLLRMLGDVTSRRRVHSSFVVHGHEQQ